MSESSRIARVGVFNPGDLLGDGIMRLPLLDGIRRRWPDHELSWVTAGPSSLEKALAQYAHPLVDEFRRGPNIESRLEDLGKGVRELPRFDIVFVIYYRTSSVLAAKFFLRPEEFYACLGLQVGATRRDPNWIVRRPSHMADRLASMARAARCDLRPLRQLMPVSDAARLTASRLLPGAAPAIGFVINTGNRVLRKAWPLDRFLELARRVIAQGGQPVFCIGPDELGQMDRIRSELPSAVLAELYRPDKLTGASGVDLCLALGERFDAAVATDTGLAHALAVVDTPIVSLFGPTDPDRWRPRASMVTVIRAQDYGSSLMDAIPVDPVEDALNRTLQARTARTKALA